MQRIAVYGKGGIGKSTISANLTAALSENGVKVMQIGCDPKHDSTRLLTCGSRQETVLEYLKDVPEPHRRMGDIVQEGYRGCLCVEAGGPEPGIGCAGRGIISAFELLHELGVDSIPLDMTIYDVLGDVVCGGFAVPLRDSYADTVYIVTSGEFMSIYAANNILRGTANYNPDRIGGIIFNSRGDDEEKERVKRFSDAVGIPVIAEFQRSREFLDAEQKGMTVVQAFPDSDITGKFRELAKKVVEGKKHTAHFLSETELENIVLNRSVEAKIKRDAPEIKAKEEKRYTSRNVHRNEVLHGCAFNGASSVTLSIHGLATVYHSPRSCAQYAFHMAPNALRRGNVRDPPISAFADPSVRCTDMNESSMIFGGTDDLERTINDLVDNGHKNIAVVTSCPSGIIGDDVRRVVNHIKTKHDVNVIVLEEDGDIRGDFMQGVIDASMGLIRALSKKGLEKRDSVNLVGVKTLSTNCNRNIAMAREILNSMDIELNCSLVGNTSVESIINMTEARVNMMMYPDRFALMLRDFLIDEYDMAFTKNIIRPGMDETEAWINEVARVFNKEDDAKRTVASLRKEFDMRISRLRKDLDGISVYIVGMHKDINWIMETALGSGMDVVGTVVMDMTDHLEDYDLDIKYKIEYRTYDEVQSVIDDIERKRPNLILSPYPMDVECDAEQCLIPISPDLGPFSGPELAEDWVRAMKAPKEEGWRKDVIRS